MKLNTLKLTTIFVFFHCLVCSGETDKIIKNIEFAKINDQSLKLDLHLPKKVKGSNLVVWIHGGGWYKGSKNDCKIKWLTNHGYSVASISYRLSQIAKFPAQIHDCKGAIRWLKSQENKFGYDSSKIVAAGASAGGYLATLLGTSHGVKQLEGENAELQRKNEELMERCKTLASRVPSWPKGYRPTRKSVDNGKRYERRTH